MNILSRLIQPAPVQADEILAEGQVLPILGGMQVLETAGHTPGHISFFVPSTGILFAGDSIVSDERGLHSSRPELSWDLARAVESARKQAALQPRIVCSGHGPVVKDAAGRMPVT